jgi:hypothetical protein
MSVERRSKGRKRATRTEREIRYRVIITVDVAAVVALLAAAYALWR